MFDSPLEFQDVGHCYGEQLVLSEVNLSLAPGELVSVLGASGSGKSTLLRTAAGFVTPTSGSIRLSGRVVVSGGVERVAPEERRVGMMFQDFALFPHMTVAENIGFGLRESGEARIRELVGVLGLDGLEERMPGSLSGGQQQRVGLARALAPKPALLLLDEPFANLEGALRFEIGREVLRIVEQERIGALLVTHDREEALGLAHRVAVLAAEGSTGSRLEQVGPPETVYRWPRTAAVASLTGRVSFTENEMQRWSSVRPHEATFSPREGGPARVVERRYMGASWEITVATPGGEVLVDAPTDAVPSLGAHGDLLVHVETVIPPLTP